RCARLASTANRRTLRPPARSPRLASRQRLDAVLPPPQVAQALLPVPQATKSANQRCSARSLRFWFTKPASPSPSAKADTRVANRLSGGSNVTRRTTLHPPTHRSATRSTESAHIAIQSGRLAGSFAPV